MLRELAPAGLDQLRAVAVLFGKTLLAEQVGFEQLPEEAAWTDELRPALLWRSTQALRHRQLDSVLGGERWRHRRHKRMADVHMLAEEAVAALRKVGRAGVTPLSAAVGKKVPRSVAVVELELGHRG